MNKQIKMKRNQSETNHKPDGTTQPQVSPEGLLVQFALRAKIASDAPCREVPQGPVFATPEFPEAVQQSVKQTATENPPFQNNNNNSKKQTAKRILGVATEKNTIGKTVAVKQ